MTEGSVTTSETGAASSTAKDITVIGIVGVMLTSYLNSGLAPVSAEVKDMLLLGVPFVAASTGKVIGGLGKIIDVLTVNALLWNAKRKAKNTLKDPNVSPKAKQEAQDMYDQYAILQCAPVVSLTPSNETRDTEIPATNTSNPR